MSKAKAHALGQHNQHANRKASSIDPPFNNGHGKNSYLETCHARSAIEEPSSDVQGTKTPYAEDRVRCPRTSHSAKANLAQNFSYLRELQKYAVKLSTDHSNSGTSSWSAVGGQVHDNIWSTGDPPLWYPLPPPTLPRYPTPLPPPFPYRSPPQHPQIQPLPPSPRHD